MYAISSYFLRKETPDGWVDVVSSGAAEIEAFIAYDDGDGRGECLYVGGADEFPFGVPGVWGIQRYDGAKWESVGFSQGLTRVSSLAVHDDGTGPALYVAGNFTKVGLAPCAGVARMRHGSWSAAPTPPVISPRSLASGVVNGVSTLFVAGVLPGETLVQAVCAYANGAWTVVWSDPQLSPLAQLCVYDCGDGGALYALDSRTLRRIRGNSVETLVNSLGVLDRLVVANTPEGERLFLIGAFESINSIPAGGIAVYDGVQWSTYHPSVGSRAYDLAEWPDDEGTIFYVSRELDTRRERDGAEGVNRPNGRIATSVEFDLGNGAELILGGSFTAIGPFPVTGVAAWNGTSLRAIGAGLYDVVALEIFDDGGGSALYAACTVTPPEVTPRKYGIRKWNGQAWQTIGIDSTSEIRALRAFDDNSGPGLYFGGGFTSINGQLLRTIGRWDGSQVHTLNGGLFRLGGQIGVTCLHVFDDGGGPALYVGGQFEGSATLDGRCIMKWKDGQWHNLGAGVADPDLIAMYVRSIAGWMRDGTPELYITGRFAEIDGVSAKNIARWNGSAWQALGDGLGGEFGLFYGGLAVDALGVVSATPHVYVGGVFSTAGGQPAQRLARWDGVQWRTLGTFSPEYFGDFLHVALLTVGETPGLLATGQIFDVGQMGVITAGAPRLAAQPGDAYAVSGTTATFVAQLQPGVEDTRWHVDGEPLSDGLTPWGSVISGATSPQLSVTNVQLQDEGDFELVLENACGATYSRRASLRVISACARELTDDPTLMSLDGVVRAQLAHGNDLYAGGDFVSAGSQLLNHIGRWDGHVWHPLGSGSRDPVTALCWLDDELVAGGRFEIDGTLHYIARWNGTTWRPLGLGVDGEVTALHSVGDVLFVGGEFLSAGGLPAPHIAAWQNNTWYPLGAGFQSTVARARVASISSYMGRLQAGGDLSYSSGISLHNIATFLGAYWTRIGDGLNGTVLDLAWRDGALVAAGEFSEPNNPQCKGLAQYTQQSGWTYGLGSTNGSISAIERVQGGLLLGGAFTSVNGQPATSLAQLNDDGSWVGFVTNGNLFINCVTASSNDVYIGGTLFTHSDVAYIGKLTTSSPLFSAQPASATVTTGHTVVLSASAAGNGTVAYTWLRDGDRLKSGSTPWGSTLSGCRSETLTIASAQADDAGLYLVEARDNCGRSVSLVAEVTVEAPPVCIGDMNCDGAIDFADIDRFIEALSHPGGEGWPHICPWIAGDANADGSVDFADIDAFIPRVGLTCP